MTQIPIDELIRNQRANAIAIAQSVLPIVLQAEMARVNQECLVKDDYAGVAPGVDLPDAHDVARYALEIGAEFIQQAQQLLDAPVPGLTGTS